MEVAAAEEEEAPIKVGASLPLTGSFSIPGEKHGDGYQLCIDLINEAGGLLGRPVELLVSDNQSDDEGIQLIRALQTVDYQPQDLFMSQGAQREFLEELGEAADGVMVHASWHPQANFVGLLNGEDFSNEDFLTAFEGKFGRPADEDEAIPFALCQGTITALIGPNGAGKTTVFNLISGLLRMDAGKIFFNGAQISGLKPNQITRKGISRTFQITRDLQEMTVLENMVVQSPIRGLGDLIKRSILAEERERAMSLLEFVGIAHLAHEKSRKLSYGQKKLLEFASVLMPTPQLIMLDEPAGGVNPALLEIIIERINELNQQGITFLIVEHNMDVVMNLSNPIIVMVSGRVLAQGSPEAIQSDQSILEAYLGEAA